MFKIGNVEVKNPIILAPLAGYTNQAYRKIIKEFGVSLVYTEMISAKGLIYDNDKTWNLTDVNENEHPIAIQLFGGNAEDLVKAAIMIDQKTNADIIDINMGCPVKKVIKANSGV
ncbi:MAG: tRNA-dihydrouridine synthase, partial [Bacilli bacterium]|nr:tRNA-dihydrouridine synthase [Bacilli bacterium]